MAAANALADFEGGSGNTGVAAAASIRPAHPRPRAGVSAGTGAGFFDQESVQASSAPAVDLAPRSAAPATGWRRGRGRGRGRGGPGRGSTS